MAKGIVPGVRAESIHWSCTMYIGMVQVKDVRGVLGSVKWLGQLVRVLEKNKMERLKEKRPGEEISVWQVQDWHAFPQHWAG